MRIITDGSVAVSFDNSTDIALGPVFNDADGYTGLEPCVHSAREMAVGFWKWFLRGDVELFDDHDWDDLRSQFIEFVKLDLNSDGESHFILSCS